ncbi:hypothetical protein QCA50_011105 [Cerrena zonata]|uniref:Uncharacterized protein n=1 Tax=Cerrena zonata TaxID=2478898 RepID=A0AAW0G376_9APHY
MAEMARRSKALPLRVETCRMQHYGYKIDHYLDFVIENIQRIESVDLAWLNHSVKPNVIGEAPILRELHIVDGTLHSLPVPPALETLRLYEGFKLKPFWTFICGIPGLRRLELYGVKLPRNVAELFSQFSSLEYLVLSKLERDRNINALLKLDLSASRDISLPNLKLLSVKINSRGIVTCNLLSRFLLLPSTKVAILADYLAQIFDEVENNVEFVAHSISRALFSSEGTEFSTVALEITQNVIIFKGWWTAPTPPMHQHIGNRLAEHVERPDFFFRTYLLEGEDHVIEGLMRQFNLARVASLMVETSLNDESTLLSVPSWARILQRIESVTSLYCRGIGIERLLDSLGVRQYEYERGERIVLPHLRKVFVSEDPYYSSWPYRSRPAFETLERFAKRRQSLDDALDFVSYYAGRPQASDMETLQSLVLELDTSGTLWK